MSSENKLLLICPRFFGYEKEIVEQSIDAGWDVTYIDTRPENTFTTKVMLRIGAEWFIKKKLQHHHDSILHELSNGKYQKILFINPEGFRDAFFIRMNEIVPEIEKILYIWDSISNKPLLKPLIKYFKKVYTFDSNDAELDEKLNFLPLFFSERYFDVSGKSIGHNKLNYDISFVGTVHSQRLEIVESISRQCNTLGLMFYKYLYVQSRVIFWVRKMTNLKYSAYRASDFKFSPLSPQQVTDIVRDSLSVLDIEHHRQRGLTMRTFEVLSAGRKLITTNADIRNYDIYHPHNVLIIDRTSPVIDPDFFNTPFYHYPKEIILKYSLSNWVKTLLS